jgi:DNA polymerase-3 subunit delta
MQIKPYQADAFINNIASNKDVFAVLLYGPESGLASIRANKIAKSIVDDLSDAFLVSNINAAQIEEDKGILADEFASMSMLGGRKLIIVGGTNKITESLKIIFEASKKQKDFKLKGDNFILIKAGDLEKSSSLRKFADSNKYIASIACYEDDKATISNIIRSKFKEHNLTFDNEVVELLQGKFGKNRQIILNEIEKLAVFMGKESHITVEILEENIADIAQVSAFGLVSSFANRDLKTSILFLEKLYAEKTSPIAIIRFLSSYFSKLALVKNNVENGSNLDLEMKIQSIFFKQQTEFKKHLNMWGKPAISGLLLKLQELEVKCKSSNFDGETMLSMFINFVLIKKQAIY